VRDSVLDAMRDLLLTRDWSAVTLSDVAEPRGSADNHTTIRLAAGPGAGLPLRLADRLVDTCTALDANVATSTSRSCRFSVVLLRDGFRSAGDLAPDRRRQADLLQIITTDSAPIITRASNG